MMNKIVRVLIVLGILAALIISAVPIGATNNPDSAPTIESINVYRNLLVTGDYLYVWEANIPYSPATIPSLPVNQTFVWRLMNGATELGSTVGYPYNHDGYGYNVYSLYFNAVDAAALGMVWGTAYTLRLSENPAQFSTVLSWNYPVTGYTILTTTADNKSALAATILNLASSLTISWALTTGYELTAETETGTALSIFGESVFRGSIYGCQSLAPSAFAAIIVDINAPARSWNNSYVNTLDNQYAGSWVETSFNASKAIFGASVNLTAIIFLIILCIILLIGNLSLTSDPWNAMIDIIFLLVIACRVGLFGLGYLAIAASVAIIYLGIRIWRLIPT
jgi:hypothetical protein